MASNSFTDSLQKAQERLNAQKEQAQKQAELRKKALTDDPSSEQKHTRELIDNHNERQAWRDQAKKYGNSM